VTFDMLDAKRIESAAQHYLSYKNDNEARHAMQNLVERFHESETWEKICFNAEDQLVGQIAPLLRTKPSVDDTMTMHVTMMALISVAFVAGFDSGFQLQVDNALEKFGGLS
jgi:type I site-specific restriction endonuclease